MKLPKLPRALLRADSYELRGLEIIRGRGSKPEDRLRVADIKSWQIHPEMVFDMVEITLADSQRVVWLDKYDDLRGILHRVAVDRELSAG